MVDDAVIFPSCTTSMIAPKQLNRQVAANSGLIAASIAAPACRCLVLVCSFHPFRHALGAATFVIWFKATC